MSFSQQRPQPNGSGGTQGQPMHNLANGSNAHNVINGDSSNNPSPTNTATTTTTSTTTTNNNNNNNESGSTTPPDPNQTQTPQRRKKASRACFHCQKAHLTCDDSRPCQRCIKRDLASTCADGVRKKAKYLQDAYDAQQLAAEQSAQATQSGPSTDLSTINHQLMTDQDQQQRQATLTDANAIFGFPMTSDYGFGSEAVNLEYSIISTMLSSPTADLNPMSDLSIVENWQRQGGLDAMASLANNNQLQKALAAQGVMATAAAAAGARSGTGTDGSSITGAMSNGGAPAHNSITNGNNSNNNVASNGAAGLLGPGASTANPTNTTSPFQHTTTTRVSKRKFPSNTPENVYANTKQPFNYTDGFHYLLRYVRERMDKEEMMRICRAMAMFRPSFIALIMNLTPEDLIFMEKCFQRTILEFEKLISFSGTPTVVWRRTGEIALVGKEFSLLTQWGRDQLVGKKTYIYELMDNQSAVEYWEKFSTHAFENTEQTVMTTCILLSPTNRVVPCTFCFTIKRDIFDIPLAIVGNFLPILS
ncbi:hypothetical protein BCR41DRAFT_356654 [Lobosporangium transversale]|uniref:Zn(2)-C6 fungal-type domain-containing protein n=1 Tax=Lobosporangium transversale TaxID=64571 RepID=A0A1Y2GJ41_9FUNG|nr:hypothetical protein BCR41DRAFT_356654 [Lobosporangium transversale]ORZ12191.1 hypothetical protein BCR41DRAFT_356654 [Lobosporangium transversale]|eukprot:XP_021880056.1 hypothetical protein BCR41DRAFT_356654 [Lobosporangium transversale]